jgi:hypothetical protein
MHRYRLLVGAVILIAAQAGAEPVKTCRIDGFPAVSLARANGFQFAQLDSDASTCMFDNASIVVAAPQDRGAQCRFRLFSGQPLSAGWTIRRIVVEFSSQGTQAELTPLPNGQLLTMRVPKGKTRLFTIRRVHLRGSDCQAWRDAFG